MLFLSLAHVFPPSDGLRWRHLREGRAMGHWFGVHSMAGGRNKPPPLLLSKTEKKMIKKKKKKQRMRRKEAPSAAAQPWPKHSVYGWRSWDVRDVPTALPRQPKTSPKTLLSPPRLMLGPISVLATNLGAACAYGGARGQVHPPTESRQPFRCSPSPTARRSTGRS